MSAPPDIVYISDLAVDAVIGVYAHERNIRQTVRISLEIETDTRQAAADDNLALAVDYDAIATRITAFVNASRFKLIETLAEQIAHIVVSEFGVQKVHLTVAKPGAVSNASDVGVRITRPRH